jgi:hypothetical protein
MRARRPALSRNLQSISPKSPSAIDRPGNILSLKLPSVNGTARVRHATPMHTHINDPSHRSARGASARALLLIKKASPDFERPQENAYFCDENRSMADQPIGSGLPLADPAAPIHRVDEVAARSPIDMQMHMFMLKISKLFE